MKHTLFALAMFFSTAAFLPLKAQKILNPVLTLQMPETGGANSAAVVWNPVTKKYYTSMAGNAIYLMGVFDAKGKLLQGEMEAEYDYRGLWYNSISKRIEFNCYQEGGLGHLVLDAKGNIKTKIIDIEGTNQPDDQSVGVYHTTGKCIIFLSTNGFVEKYNAKTGKTIATLITLHPGNKTQIEVDEINADSEEERWLKRNSSCVQYTGIPKSELAILNVEDRTIELYDQKTGLLTKIAYRIPEGIELQTSFNFCYTNGYWWLFNKEEKKWVGYK